MERNDRQTTTPIAELSFVFAAHMVEAHGMTWEEMSGRDDATTEKITSRFTEAAPTCVMCLLIRALGRIMMGLGVEFQAFSLPTPEEVIGITDAEPWEEWLKRREK